MIVTVEELVVGLVPNTAVIPDGQLTAANVTPALNPFAGVTVTVEEPFAPPAVASAAVALNAKLGGGALTVSAIVVEALNTPLVPLTVSE